MSLGEKFKSIEVPTFFPELKFMGVRLPLQVLIHLSLDQTKKGRFKYLALSTTFFTVIMDFDFPFGLNIIKGTKKISISGW